MKKKLLFIFALLCAVAQGAWSQNVVNLSTLTSDYEAHDGDVLTGNLASPYKVIIDDNATVTLSGVSIINDLTDKIGSSYIKCLGNAGIILAEGTTNEISSYDCPGIWVGPEGTTTTIKGTGSIKVKVLWGYCPGIGGFENCGNIVIENGIIEAEGHCFLDANLDNYAGPGIGASPNYSCGDITIKGGKITAYGGDFGAGIGKGSVVFRETKCGTIKILGGEVNAFGGIGAAGIGGGNNADGCVTLIDGGVVYAYGGDGGAGIGGGSPKSLVDPYGGNGGNITINGGTIVAKGGEEGAGIGGGEDGTGGNIFIYGGDITAYGGDYGAGIGGGNGARGGAIWITGGTVKAYGGTDAAGIGGGEDGDSGSIVINGGDVYASGDGWGVGIGAGEDGDVDNTISINGGTVDAYGGLDIRRAIGGEDDEDYDPISIGDRVKVTDVSSGTAFSWVFKSWRSYYQSYIRLKFEPCDHAGATYSIVNAEKHQCICQWCGNFEEDHSYGDNGLCACGYGTELFKVHLYAIGSDRQYQEVSTMTVAEGKDFTLPLTTDTPSDYLFRCWAEGEPEPNEGGIVKDFETNLEPGTVMTMHDKDLYFKARYEFKNVNLRYIDADLVAIDGMVIYGSLNDNRNSIRRITIADGATVTLRDATILGTDREDCRWPGIYCAGDATIILEGTNIVKGFWSFAPGIFVTPGKTLTIQGDGSLDASSNGYGAGIGGSGESGLDCGNIVINGGAIKATGGYISAGIGAGKNASCGDITISNKVISVTAIKGKDAPYSIGANDGITGTVTIGKVKTGPISESPYTYYPSLDVSGDMTADLEEAMGQAFDITFRGRKFIIDSEWNTLCLPFSMTAEQISNSPLNNSKIVELDTEKTTLSDGVLTIAYKTATAIEAGKPYMVKWAIDEEAEDTHIDDPIFKNVTISTAAPTAVSAAGISFCGAFAPLTLASGDKTRLWLDDDVRLRWASGQDEQVSPTWCYWNLGALDASTLNAIVVTFDDGSRPIVELMDGMTDFSILSKFGEQEVNASLEGRELSAVQQADGTWQSRAYTLCLPFYAELFGTGCDFTIYSKAEVTEDGELLFTQEMLPFLNPGNAYLIVVNEGTLRLQEEAVTLVAEADEADDWENAVLLNYVDEQIAGYWLGSLKTIGHDEAVSRRAFTLTGDGSFQRITDGNPTWQWPAFRAMFCAKPNIIAQMLPTQYQLDANGEEEEDRSLPAPESYQGDNDGEATGIAPVIHTIDLDGTERWFDLSGCQLSGKPTKKGVYIHRGKKQVVK